MVKKNSTSIRLNTPLTNDDASAVDGLSGGAVSLQADKTSHLTDDGTVVSHKEGDVALLAESSDELGVSVLIAGRRKESEVSLSSIKRLNSLVKTTSKTVVVKGVTENNLKSLLGGKLDLGDDLSDLSNNNFTVK